MTSVASASVEVEVEVLAGLVDEPDADRLDAFGDLFRAETAERDDRADRLGQHRQGRLGAEPDPVVEGVTDRVGVSPARIQHGAARRPALRIGLAAAGGEDREADEVVRVVAGPAMHATLPGQRDPTESPLRAGERPGDRGHRVGVAAALDRAVDGAAEVRRAAHGDVRRLERLHDPAVAFPIFARMSVGARIDERGAVEATLGVDHE